LGERAWVDNSLCEEFIDGIKTAFSTKPIPFSVDNATNSPIITTNSNNGLLNENGKKTPTQSAHQSDRYATSRSEIEAFVIDVVKSQMANANSKSSMIQQRLLGQNIAHMGSQNLSSPMDNRGFLKLLQNTCGIAEIRAIALNKIEFWLANPKIISLAQDLLLAICINCVSGVNDRELITQILKLKPKIKQQQHYYDCIRELIKTNPLIFEFLIQLATVNELMLQQQQQQSQQQAQQQIARNQHNLYLLQTALSTDPSHSSKIFAQTMQRILLQKNGDDYLRLLRILLRDVIKNSRNDFDLIKFTSELVSDVSSLTTAQSQEAPSFLNNFAGGLVSFSSIQMKERYANGVCDLITVCILVAITPQIKEAYLRRHVDTREFLIKYYMLMAQIQCDTVSWLQEIIKNFQINSTELIRCMFKILFMIDKPEQCYTIDNWPSEQERSTMFRVVSEIPVLSETLHQVLMITKSLPEDMYLHMLRVEENLLKVAALVHIKEVYSLKLNKIDQFVQSLFSICLYRYQPSLIVTVLYWRAWQILLIVSALDPKGFGLTAWEKYPTLRLLMEMIMCDDYNFPPQSSLTEEITVDKYRYDENQVCLIEKQEILDFENKFEMKQGI